MTWDGADIKLYMSPLTKSYSKSNINCPHNVKYHYINILSQTLNQQKLIQKKAFNQQKEKLTKRRQNDLNKQVQCMR